MSAGNLDGLLSPFLRNRRLSAARKYIAGRVLDYGCGRGDVCSLVEEGNYVGVDSDVSILATARRLFPKGTFLTPDEFEGGCATEFDTIVALAVIEHLPDPTGFLRRMKQRLRGATGKIVLTTPVPSLDWIHGLGGHVGIFAKEGHYEHQSLMNRKQLESVTAAAGLKLAHYQRFLFGANQLAILTQ